MVAVGMVAGYLWVLEWNLSILLIGGVGEVWVGMMEGDRIHVFYCRVIKLIYQFSQN
jgi:hypothetical protein